MYVCVCIYISHLMHVVLVHETRIILPNLKFSEGRDFYGVILDSLIHAHLPYISSRISGCSKNV